MTQNFQLRKRMFGEDALGKMNLEMVRCAERAGASAKFCGSGGALLVCCSGGEQQSLKLIEECEKHTFMLERVKVAEQLFESM